MGQRDNCMGALQCEVVREIGIRWDIDLAAPNSFGVSEALENSKIYFHFVCQGLVVHRLCKYRSLSQRRLSTQSKSGQTHGYDTEPLPVDASSGSLE